MSGQVVLPSGALVALLSGTTTGAACLKLLGVVVSDVAQATARRLDAVLGTAGEEGARTLVRSRSIVASSDRCLVLTTASGDLRAAWVFVAGEQAAALAMSPAGLHISVLSLAEMRVVLETWIGLPTPDGMRLVMLTSEGAQSSVLVKGEAGGQTVSSDPF